MTPTKLFIAFPLILKGYVFQILLWMIIAGTTLTAQNKLTRDEINNISRAVVQVIAPDGKGSGSIVNGSGLIYTNRHVAQNYDEFTIAILSNPHQPAVPTFKAELVSYSPEYDFAVLRITTDLEGREVTAEELRNGYGDVFTGFPVLEYATTEQIPGRGDEIAILGYPGIGDDELVYTKGIISSLKYDTYAENEIPVWYRTTAEMSPGNSGGIAINESGKVIGLPTYVRTEAETGGRLGNILAIPMVDAIIEAGDLLQRWDEFDASGKKGGQVDRVDFDLEPTYGEQVVEDITNAPIQIDITSGGEINTGYIGGDCNGFVSSAPDYRIQYKGQVPALYFKFEAKASDEDATLLVNLPDGEWVCNDDASEGILHPAILIENPPHGQYDVWVGSFNEGEYLEGNLTISSRNTPVVTDKKIEVKLDFNLEPYFASMTFNTGFTPNPFTLSGQTGGEVDVRSINIGEDCSGFASTAPDYRLNWTGTTQQLSVYFEADNQGENAMLIINAPDGSWICNDDAHSNTLNPMILLGEYEEGQFDIWIGSQNQEEYINGVLTITEHETKPRD